MMGENGVFLKNIFFPQSEISILEVVFMEKGRTIGKEKLVALFDDGTFVETGAYIKRADGELTGVVSGYGAVGGKLVYAFAQDSDRKRALLMRFKQKKLRLFTLWR